MQAFFVSRLQQRSLSAAVNWRSIARITVRRPGSLPVPNFSVNQYRDDGATIDFIQ